MDEGLATSPNAVRERQIVFHSPVSPESLKRQVVEGTVTRKAAVAAVRRALKDPEVASLMKEAEQNEIPADQLAQHRLIVKAKGVVAAEVEAVLSKKPKAPKPKARREPVARGTVVDGVCDFDNFLGRRVRLELRGTESVMADIGASDSDASMYNPEGPTTRTCWAIDVAAAVDMLPGELRSQVTVHEVEQLEPVHCATCNGTVWRERGGCPRCDPVTSTSEVRDRIIGHRVQERIQELAAGGMDLAWARMKAWKEFTYMSIAGRTTHRAGTRH